MEVLVHGPKTSDPKHLDLLPTDSRSSDLPFPVSLLLAFGNYLFEWFDIDFSSSISDHPFFSCPENLLPLSSLSRPPSGDTYQAT